MPMLAHCHACIRHVTYTAAVKHLALTFVGMCSVPNRVTEKKPSTQQIINYSLCAICCASPTWMSILRKKGMTKAGFMLLRRPIVQIASSLISNTSSFSATNSACRFSAWARWASKRSSRDASTQYRMSGSVGEQGQEKVRQTLSSRVSC